MLISTLLKLSAISTILITSNAFARSQEISDGVRGSNSQLVKQVFLKLANQKGSPIQLALQNQIHLAEADIGNAEVSVVPYQTFNYVGKGDSDGNWWPDEFDGSYWVFVGFTSGGRGSSGGSIRFNCTLSYKDNKRSANDVKCEPKYVDVSED